MHGGLALPLSVPEYLSGDSLRCAEGTLTFFFLSPFQGFSVLILRAWEDPFIMAKGAVNDSVQQWNKATQSLCIIAMTVFFMLRVYTRLRILNGFGKEDCE